MNRHALLTALSSRGLCARVHGSMKRHAVRVSPSRCIGYLLIPFAFLVGLVGLSPLAYSAPLPTEYLYSPYVPNTAESFGLLSEETAVRVEKRNGSDRQNPQSGRSAYHDTYIPNSRPYPLAGFERQEESGFFPSFSSDNPLPSSLYRYHGYVAGVTAVGATTAAAMAAPAGNAPVQKISGRQSSDDWWDENAGDPGEASNEYPVGEPTVLLLFALFLAIHRLRKARTPDNNKAKDTL
ncbi:MAG: hypothetical protein ACI4BD_08805 [Paludibacteraceae bacterium]